MFNGVSTSTRPSHQSPIAVACALVSDAANLQPALPVQAMRPARTCEALTASPIASIGFDRELHVLVAHARDQEVLPHGQADLAVAKIGARSWRGRASARRSSCRPAATTPIQFRPSCFCGWTPIWAIRSKAGRGASASGGARVRAWPSFARPARGISPCRSCR